MSGTEQPTAEAPGGRRPPRRPPRRPSSGPRGRTLLVGAVVLVVVAAGVALVLDRTGRISLPFAGRSYCEVVHDQQETMTRAIRSGSPTALLRVLPELEAYQRTSPDDVADEWQQIVTRVQALQDALDRAGVSASSYDPRKPPSGLTQQQKADIFAAATDLLRPETLQSLDTVSQEVRDVCHTPLYQ